MLNRFPLMRGSFWINWKKPESIRLMVFRRRSPSNKRLCLAVRARPVGTVTEIYDLHATPLFFNRPAALSQVWRSDHQQSVEQIVRTFFGLTEGENA